MDIFTFKDLNKYVYVYLNYLYQSTDSIIFMTLDGTLKMRIKLTDLYENSVLYETLKKFPDKEFILACQALEKSHYDLKDEFVSEYLNNINNTKIKKLNIK